MALDKDKIIFYGPFDVYYIMSGNTSIYGNWSGLLSDRINITVETHKDEKQLGDGNVITTITGRKLILEITFEELVVDSIFGSATLDDIKNALGFTVRFDNGRNLLIPGTVYSSFAYDGEANDFESNIFVGHFAYSGDPYVNLVAEYDTDADTILLVGESGLANNDTIYLVGGEGNADVDGAVTENIRGTFQVFVDIDGGKTKITAIKTLPGDNTFEQLFYYD